MSLITVVQFTFHATAYNSYTSSAIKRRQLVFICNFVKNQRILMQFSLLDLKMNSTWQYKLHPLHLINVATLPCESQNTENVTLQRDITKENCTRYITASSKWTSVTMCLKFTYVGFYIAMSVWNKDSMTSTTYKNAWCKLCLALTRTSLTLQLTSGVTIRDHVYTLVVDTLNTCSNMKMFIYMIYENILWKCQWNLMVGWLEFNVAFQHKYSYIRDDVIWCM